MPPLTNLEGTAVAPLLKGVTQTKCGALMLPDTNLFGPLYWAVIERCAPPGGSSRGGAALERAEEEAHAHEAEPQAESTGTEESGQKNTDQSSRVLDCL